MVTIIKIRKIYFFIYIISRRTCRCSWYSKARQFFFFKYTIFFPPNPLYSFLSPSNLQNLNPSPSISTKSYIKLPFKSSYNSPSSSTFNHPCTILPPSILFFRVKIFQAIKEYILQLVAIRYFLPTFINYHHILGETEVYIFI